jgi:2-hydroxy-3-oxopropionate reductase
LRTAADVVAVLDRVGVANVGFLCDLFHLANNGDDLDSAITDYSARIAHVQIADHPGRHELGTGALDLDHYLTRIADSGYTGRVALEYVPTTNTPRQPRLAPRRAPSLISTPKESDTAMSTIALIRLGIMGGPMAGHLVRAGHTVVGVNRSPEPVQRLIEAGGQGADTVAEAVGSAEVIITMVPDSADVEGVALGENGIYAHAPRGAMHIDMSSIRPDVAANLAAAGQEAGIRVLDAPVSGGQAGAVEAKLSIMVGGESADFEEVKPLLETVGSTIVWVGPAGSGQTVKAANQLIVAGTIELVAEAIVLRRAYGVDTEAAVAVLCRPCSSGFR